MSLLNEIKKLKADLEAELSKCSVLSDVDVLNIKYLGRKNGLINGLVNQFYKLSVDEKKKIGKEFNSIKKELEMLVNSKKESIIEQQRMEKLASIDVTLDSRKLWKGSIHPITKVMEELKDIFRTMGFQVELGPEVEDEFHNFDALNIPDYHPARDMQDTFFVEATDTSERYVLRTHTSPVQIRTMQKLKNPPIKMIAPGKVYRNEEISARSYAYFHQLEGLFIDKDVKFSHLKGVLDLFLKRLYGDSISLRYRPSYFPFTEPSVEIDVSCVICGGEGCSVCKHTGWLEVLGAGMVHPEVLKSGGIDSEKYSGFAFGMGIERIAMLKYAITDIRLFHENNIKFLEQF